MVNIGEVTFSVEIVIDESTMTSHGSHIEESRILDESCDLCRHIHE